MHPLAGDARQRLLASRSGRRRRSARRSRRRPPCAAAGSVPAPCRRRCCRDDEEDATVREHGANLARRVALVPPEPYEAVQLRPVEVGDDGVAHAGLGPAQRDIALRRAGARTGGGIGRGPDEQVQHMPRPPVDQRRDRPAIEIVQPAAFQAEAIRRPGPAPAGRSPGGRRTRVSPCAGRWRPHPRRWSAAGRGYGWRPGLARGAGALRRSTTTSARQAASAKPAAKPARGGAPAWRRRPGGAPGRVRTAARKRSGAGGEAMAPRSWRDSAPVAAVAAQAGQPATCAASPAVRAGSSSPSSSACSSRRASSHWAARFLRGHALTFGRRGSSGLPGAARAGTSPCRPALR